MCAVYSSRVPGSGSVCMINRTTGSMRTHTHGTPYNVRCEDTERGVHVTGYCTCTCNNFLYFSL